MGNSVLRLGLRFRRNNSSCVTGFPGLSEQHLPVLSSLGVLQIDTELLIRLLYHASVWRLVKRDENAE